VGTPFKNSWSEGWRVDDFFLVESFRGRDIVGMGVYVECAEAGREEGGEG